MKYVEVILPLPLDGTFTYAVGDVWSSKIKPGVRLLVPLGKSKRYIAVAVCMTDQKPDFDVKEIVAVLDDNPVILPNQLKLWHWISNYYLSSLGDIFKAALPSGLKTQDSYKPKTEQYVGLTELYRNEQALHIAINTLSRATKQQKALIDYLAMSHWDSLNGTLNAEDIVEVTKEELMNFSHSNAASIKSLVDRKILYTYNKEVGRLNNGGKPHLENIKHLNEFQTKAFDDINSQFEDKQVVLLHGVTSSGKTEIYIHLIKKALDEHKQVLYLLPEIALTVQIMQRLKKVFGNRLGIYHSKYSDAERVEIWNKQLSDSHYDVILGARSAVFLPFTNLGLVIIDEEHETSFKQQDPAPRYHARSSAIVLAGMYGAKTLLGTATPSMESYYNAQQGKYGLVELKKRFAGIELPEIRVVDIKDLQHRKMMQGPFSPQMLAAINNALQSGKQVILFQKIGRAHV